MPMVVVLGGRHNTIKSSIIMEMYSFILQI